MQYILDQDEYDHYQELKRHAKVTQGQSIVITRPDPNNNYWNRSCVYNIPEGLEEIRKDLEIMGKDYATLVAKHNENEKAMALLKNRSLWNLLKWKFGWK